MRRLGHVMTSVAMVIVLAPAGPGALAQVPSRCSGLRPLRPADTAARPYQSEGWPGRAYGALQEGVRSAAADDACAYQSECRPGGPYGALKTVLAADPIEASIREVRKAVNAQRDGSHLSRLFSLRQLRDPALRALLLPLAEHPQWQVQVHAILGLAEIDPDGHVDPALILRVGARAQEQVIANALDLELIGVEQIRMLAAAKYMAPLPQVLLVGELVLLGEPVDLERLAALATSADVRIAGLASCLAAQLGDAAALGAYESRLESLGRRDRNRHVLWLLPAIRQYRLGRTLPWVLQLLSEPDLEPEVAYAALLTVLQLDTRTGLEHWKQLLGPSPSHRRRVRYGLLLLVSGAEIPAAAYDPLAPDEPLIEAMVRTGKALAGGSDVAEALTHLVDLGHGKTSEWALGATRDLDDDQAARVYLHLIDRVEGDRRSQGQRVSQAITATSRLFELNPQLVLERLTAAEDDGLTQQAILLGLFDSRSPAAGQAAQLVKRIGAGRADSLALTLIAKHAASLDPDELRDLALIAQGGGRLSAVLQVQAAWLYLRHTQSIDRAVAQIFGGA